MMRGMEYDPYGNELGGPKPVALTAYFDGVARGAAASELADLALGAFGHCCRCRDFYTQESEQASRSLASTSKFLGMEDGKRLKAARKAGYWMGKAEHWDANAQWFYRLAEAHKGSQG